MAREGLRAREGLSEAEGEFIAEMWLIERDSEPRWLNFDPDFRQKDIARLFRWRWFEKRTQDGYREYRITPAGRRALASGQDDATHTPDQSPSPSTTEARGDER